LDPPRPGQDDGQRSGWSPVEVQQEKAGHQALGSLAPHVSYELCVLGKYRITLGLSFPHDRQGWMNWCLQACAARLKTLWSLPTFTWALIMNGSAIEVARGPL
jgi:hypothetical protein